MIFPDLYLEVVEPLGLLVVLRGQHARVEEDEHDDDPEHGLRLDRLPQHAPRPPVQLLQRLFSLVPKGLLIREDIGRMVSRVC